jgi:hypothetical protein
MATSPRPTDSLTQLNEQLIFNPNIVADPVPPWLMTHLDKSQLVKLGQISLQRQKAIFTAQVKAVEDALKAIGT